MNTLNALSEFLPSGRLFTEESMAKHTTFRIGGPAEIFTLPQTTDEFIKIINICNENETPFHVLGDGANTLVSDGGVRGAVIKTTLLNEPIET